MPIYTLDDGNEHREYENFNDLRCAAAEWYDYLLEQTEDDGLCEKYRHVLRETNLVRKIESAKSIYDLEKTVANLEEALAKAASHEDFAGHGNYFVSAASEGGFSLGIGKKK